MTTRQTPKPDSKSVYENSRCGGLISDQHRRSAIIEPYGAN